MSETRISSISVHQLRLPLTVPYKLVFGDVVAFDTILVVVRDRDGAVGLGDATLLTGYTEETVEGSWSAANELARAGVGLATTDAVERFERNLDRNPFTVSALVSAIEMLTGHASLSARGRVPLLATVNATDPDGIAQEIETAIAAGYGTLKVKVGWDLAKDSDKLRRIQRNNSGRARLRVDANQGFSTADAVRFVGDLDPDSIELVEQTCAAGDWDAAVAVKRAATVPIMLDESIYGVADIDRAAELQAADYIKLKLMKMGGIDQLRAGLRRITDLGMKPVLGNGVASDVGCWMEAAVAAELIDNAGEMNGYLKTPVRLTDQAMPVGNGGMSLPDATPELDADAVGRHAVRSASWDAAGAAA